MVLGEGQAHRGTQTTLQKSAPAGTQLAGVVAGTTGFGTTSGFGYLLEMKDGGTRHAILALRGTRPELGAPDIVTDIRGALVGFAGYGPVHKGFKRTYESVLANLAALESRLMEAHVVHCVGHSLGGAVATLFAAHYRARGKTVKLYTFGSPRVGAFGTHLAMQEKIGRDHVYRVAHDLDPISLVGPFPYMHLNAAPSHGRFMTIPSPETRISLDNHDMANYIKSVGEGSWNYVHNLSKKLDHEDAYLARKLLGVGADSSWVQRASAKVLGLLFKLIGYYLRMVSTKIVLSLTAVDLMAEMLVTGMARATALSAEILQLLRHCATWAGIQLQAGADIGITVIAAILRAMVASLRQAAIQALISIARNIQPTVLLTGAALLTGAVAL
jgi:triacylglycerol lipase